MANIKVYSVPTCLNCNLLKQYLREKNIEFDDVNVTKPENQQKAIELTDKTGDQSFPHTEINGKVIAGFDMEVFEKELENV